MVASTLNFIGEEGANYKIYFKKGYNTGNLEGRDPNRYFFAGEYLGVEESDDEGVAHAFGNVFVPSAGTLVESIAVDDESFGTMFYATKEPMAGGRRRQHRRATRKHHGRKRRSTRARRHRYGFK
jgi:hypothetical protein